MPADETVRLYELLGSQLKELITLPAFAGSPNEILMDSARPALVCTANNEVCMCNADGAKWTAWRQLTRSHTDKLIICSMCMPTSNILLLFDYHSHSLMQYELA